MLKNSIKYWELFNNQSISTQTLSLWKQPKINEDLLFSDNKILVVSDGATDKSWKLFSWRTWGEIASDIIVKQSKNTQLSWISLAEDLNKALKDFYQKNNINFINREEKFSGTVVVVRIHWNIIKITQIWDTSFRVNWKDVYKNNKIIDIINSTFRQKFILKFWENYISEAREFILPLLKFQSEFQNNDKEVIFNNEVLDLFIDKLKNWINWNFDIQSILDESKEELTKYFWQDISYGMIDWTNTPSRFIKEYFFYKEDIESLEIFTDWYYSIPESVSISAWESAYEKWESIDPFKYKLYPSTKVNDDRSILITSFSKDYIQEQRENLLEKNYDKLYWVYEVLSETTTDIELKVLSSCLVWFWNQLDNLKDLDLATDITIIDLIKLQKGNIEILHWPYFEVGNKKIVMCSWWMIDFFPAKDITWNIKDVHMITSLRDAWGTSINQRTTVAWRVIWENIRDNIDLESAEEAPFLWIMNGEFYLAISNDKFSYLKQSIQTFLKTKYSPLDPDLTKKFERWFRWLKYVELWDVLQKIVENNRFLAYESKDINDLPWLQDLKRNVKIWNIEDSFYTMFNEEQNTYEFKIFKQFIKFPDGFELPWNRPNRLFLESFNQSPQSNRISNATKINPSGAIKKYTYQIELNVSEIIKFFQK